MGRTAVPAAVDLRRGMNQPRTVVAPLPRIGARDPAREIDVGLKERQAVGAEPQIFIAKEQRRVSRRGRAGTITRGETVFRRFLNEMNLSVSCDNPQ
jgi:hypothetical protein